MKKRRVKLKQNLIFTEKIGIIRYKQFEITIFTIILRESYNIVQYSGCKTKFMNSTQYGSS